MVVRGGHIALSGGTYFTNLLYGASAAATLTNVDNTISGSGQLGDGQMTLVNQAAGVINADAGGLYLNAGSNTVSNAGLLEATDGGTLYIQSPLNNSGRVEAFDGSAVVISGLVNNSGLLETAGSGARILLQGGTVTGKLATSPGTVIEVVNGTSEFDGTSTALDNSSTVVVDSGSTLTLAGTIDNTGSISVSGDANFPIGRLRC